MIVGSFLLFCAIISFIFRGGSLKLGKEASITFGFFFFLFVLSVSKDIQVAIGAGVALAVFTV